jgi:hypothetical protein
LTHGTRYAMIAALSGYSEFVHDLCALRGALGYALVPDKPAHVNVRIDAEANAVVNVNSMVV